MPAYLTRCLAAGLIAGSVAAAGTAAAETKIRANVGLPNTHPGAVGYQAYTDAVEKDSKGAIKFETYYGGALLSLKATLTGVRDGIADSGAFILAYWPAEFPNAKLVADFALLGGDATATAGAVAEYFLFKCPDCRAEFKKQKMVFLAPFSTPPYYLISKGKMVKPEDLKDKKIRVGGAVWSRWALTFGAVPINLPGVESYEAMSQGQIAATIASAAYLKSISMWEVADNITLIPLGTFHSVAEVGFGLDQWRRYPADVRKLLIHDAAVGMAVSTIKYVQDDEASLAAAPKHGVSINQPSPELAEATSKFIESDLAVVKADAVKAKVTDVDAKIATFRQLMAKWTKLTKPLGLDRDKVVELYRKELFDKLDAARYGL